MEESPMLSKHGLCNITMSNIEHKFHHIIFTNLSFGGQVMALGGDFYHSLPVQPQANWKEFVDLAIKSL